MRLDAACRPVFARHESFPPRYGWVKKAHDGAESDPEVFGKEDAVVTLGVGKNMVRAIRFWGRAFKVLAEAPMSGRGPGPAVPSVFGHVLLGPKGWDQFGELPGFHWLLHWKLLAPPCLVPVWWVALNEFPHVQFTSEELEQFVADRAAEWANPHPSAITKDVSCFLRMYSTGESKRATYEDMIDTPFRELGLIRRTSDQRPEFRFMIGPKATLPPGVAAYACLDFIARVDSSASVVNVGRLASEHGSPGRAFKLTEDDLVALLERAAERFPEVQVTSSAGAPQLVVEDDPAVAATEVLSEHFRSFDRAALYVGAAHVAGEEADKPWNQARMDLGGVAR